jgi:putative YphP/YqiW family bacilliredoxin
VKPNAVLVPTPESGTVRYDPLLVQPMREELTNLGFEELLTPGDVDGVLGSERRPTLVVVNSVCGCAAGMARPGVAMALRHAVTPDRLVTVFAGMEVEAVDRVRSYFEGYAPSSPNIALFVGGRLVHMLERRDIEGRMAAEIAEELVAAFERYCPRA